MPNHLAHEISPYLLQHSNNPVDWYPWGAEALAKAKAEDKPIFLSIGYAACHWCHVMAHESFEDGATAPGSSASKWTAKSAPISTPFTWRQWWRSPGAGAGR